MKRDQLKSGDVTATILSEDGKILAVNIDIASITDENLGKAALIISALIDSRDELRDRS